MVKEAKVVDTRSLMLITVVVHLPSSSFSSLTYIRSALVRQIPISIIDHDNSVISRTAITSFGIAILHNQNLLCVA
ncbi:MAG: hypothetical protein IPG53_06480 [Ignavibacteriales bacterium]|nr:hypothetical protein [Ignavibacteriales bacterium]